MKRFEEERVKVRERIREGGGEAEEGFREMVTALTGK